MELLVSAEWLAKELGASDLRVVDATYFPLDASRDASADYEAAHIPGAVHLDLATLKDATSSLPGMLPSAEAFASRMQSLGVDDGSRVVLYDNSPQRTAARAWFMFRMFGVDRVAILDGGLGKWTAEGRPVETGKAAPGQGRFTVRRDAGAVRDVEQMKANVASRAEEVVDARSAKRFTGEEGDPRGLASGHIPGSKNLPFDRLLNADGTYRSRTEMQALFDAAGIDSARPLVTTCGSGVTASVVLFAAAMLGREDFALYDGSWSEWGMLEDTEKELGEACTKTTAGA